MSSEQLAELLEVSLSIHLVERNDHPCILLEAALSLAKANQVALLVLGGVVVDVVDLVEVELNFALTILKKAFEERVKHESQAVALALSLAVRPKRPRIVGAKAHMRTLKKYPNHDLYQREERQAAGTHSEGRLVLERTIQSELRKWNWW